MGKEVFKTRLKSEPTNSKWQQAAARQQGSLQPHEQHPAVTKPDMSGLHDHRHAAQQNDLVAPVELVSFSGCKAQRDVGRCRRLPALLGRKPIGAGGHCHEECRNGRLQRSLVRRCHAGVVCGCARRGASVASGRRNGLASYRSLTARGPA
jgi:hypothetical protein